MSSQVISQVQNLVNSKWILMSTSLIFEREQLEKKLRSDFIRLMFTFEQVRLHATPTFKVKIAQCSGGMAKRENMSQELEETLDSPKVTGT